MAIDPAQIELSPARKQRIAQLAEQQGKDYTAVVDELLASAIHSERNGTAKNGTSHTEVDDADAAADHREFDLTEEPSLYNELTKRGMLGCFEGPTDMATNPKHMEGFGRWRRRSLTPDRSLLFSTNVSSTIELAATRLGPSRRERSTLACPS